MFAKKNNGALNTGKTVANRVNKKLTNTMHESL